MNYNKIEELWIAKKIAKMTFYDEVGMSHTGFKQAIENNSLKVSTLQKIAEVLGVPVSAFFEAHTATSGGGGHPNLLESPEPWDAESTADLMDKYAGLPDAEIVNLLRQEIAVLRLRLDMSSSLLQLKQKEIERLTAKQG